MARIDELITEIYDGEALELCGNLDEEQQKRIEEKILAAIMTDENSTYRYRRNRKRFLLIGLAAILLMGLCLTSFGASHPDWGIEVLRIMGLDDTDTLQLESGEVEINESVTRNATEYSYENVKMESKEKVKPVTITAVTSIGDKNSAYIRIDTDYKVPEYFNENTDYIFPKDCSIRIYEQDPEKNGRQTDMASTFISEVRDGYLGFLVEISDCKNLNKSYVTVDLEDMYYCQNGLLEAEENNTEEPVEVNERILLEGQWNLQWKYQYKSNAKSYSIIKPITIDDETYFITQIELSPISIRMESFRMPWNREKEYTVPEVEAVCYKDGTVLRTTNQTTGGCRNGMEFESFVGIVGLGEVIDTENVEVVIVNGNKIELK